MSEPNSTGRGLVYRQSFSTRLTHWLWAISLFFLLLSGLQIFNAHPALYLGDQSGFDFSNQVLAIGTEGTDEAPQGVTEVFGHRFTTTGVLGLSAGSDGELTGRGFPAWATLPSYQDLATGRVIHFFFAWLLSATLLVWLVTSALNGHLRRDLVPRLADVKRLPADIVAHLRFRFAHGKTYNPLQKLTYFAVLFVLLPLMIATGLAMSPGMNAALPFLPELFGGRQSARTIHFALMVLIVLFFVIHLLMIVAAGPLNELRSIITGWYRTDHRPGEPGETV